MYQTEKLVHKQENILRIDCSDYTVINIEM